MLEIEVVPEMEQKLREYVKTMDMAMRDIEESDFDEIQQNSGKNHKYDIEEESPKIVDRSRQLAVS
jgi:hypothetical protein